MGARVRHALLFVTRYQLPSENTLRHVSSLVQNLFLLCPARLNPKAWCVCVEGEGDM
jgi:hypothetical protein